MLTKSLVAAAAALAATTALSLPADAEPKTEVRGAVMFWLLDRNNDGGIDKSEVEALRAVIFDTVDADGDGTVTREEFMAVLGDRGGRRGMRGEPHDGPRHGQWEGRGPQGQGKDFAERRGPGPRDGQLDARGPHDGPHGGPGKDNFAERQGPGPQHGQMEERGHHGGPHGGQYAERRGPGPQHDEWQGRGHHDGPREGGFAERRGEWMMYFLGIDEDGLSKDDFVTATPRLFERADDDGNGTVSQSEFDQASRHIGRLLILE